MIHPKFYGVVWTGSHLLDLADPDPAMINLRDIARGLARQPRFGGQTRDDLPAYSVAWHSLFCEAVADEMGLSIEVRLQTLLHDAPEFVLGDMQTPIKVIDPIYQGLEVKLWRAICLRFDMQIELHPAIKEIDNIAVEIERKHLITPGAWPPEPSPPAEWAEMGRKWIEFTHKRQPESVLGQAMFLARARALFHVRTEGVG